MKTGQMIDATFVEVPRQRNSREENAKIKAGETPDGWDNPAQAAKRRQKDTEARWTKKNAETHYGYKNHINADAATKLIQDYAVTPANVHDSQVFDDLLDTQTTDEQGRKRPVYADSAYRSEPRETQLTALEMESQIHETGTRAAPLTEAQKISNRKKSKVRARVEHIFGAQATMGGHVVRTIGIERAQVKIGLMNLAYNVPFGMPAALASLQKPIFRGPLKNFVGSFAPPFGVLVDFDFLATLPPRDHRAGLSEAVKVAVIRDGDFFRWLEAAADELAAFTSTTTEAAIRRCAALHLGQICRGGDPFEYGSARPLDFGVRHESRTSNCFHVERRIPRR